jgi:arylsulfatase
MAWIADETEARIREHEDDDRPFFGFVSFSKPHPAWNPSPPYDDLYDPDAMPEPIREDRAVDHLDEKIPAQNYHFWRSRADDTSREVIRTARAHYYGLVTQVDREVGRVLDAVEARDDAENTLICFTSDHGELLGDHHGWGKTSFFEQSARVPFLLSWPAELPAGERYDGLVSLTDIVGIATTAAGDPDLRDGVDVVGAIRGDCEGRERLVGTHETPRKTDAFTIPANATVMVREGDWKYVYAVLGGREQLFDLAADPRETVDLSDDEPDVTARLRDAAAEYLRANDAHEYLDGDALAERPFREMDMGRYHPGQYPSDPAETLVEYEDGE